MQRLGKPRLFGFGFRAVAAVAGCDEKTVRRAVAAKKLDVMKLADVVRWIAERQQAAERLECKPTIETTTAGATSALSCLREASSSPPVP